jgi:hypothetical protein
MNSDMSGLQNAFDPHPTFYQQTNQQSPRAPSSSSPNVAQPEDTPFQFAPAPESDDTPGGSAVTDVALQQRPGKVIYFFFPIPK